MKICFFLIQLLLRTLDFHVVSLNPSPSWVNCIRCNCLSYFAFQIKFSFSLLKVSHVVLSTFSKKWLKGEFSLPMKEEHCLNANRSAFHLHDSKGEITWIWQHWFGCSHKLQIPGSFSHPQLGITYMTQTSLSTDRHHFFSS